MKKIVVIHTTSVTIPSIQAIIQGELGKAEVFNLLDDSMLPEINSQQRVTEGVKFRLYNLLSLAESIGPDAILCACSSIGDLIDEAREFIRTPLYRIDEPMARMAVEAGTKIGVAATLSSTIQPTSALVKRKAREAGKNVELDCCVVEGANQLLNSGDEEGYDTLVASRLQELALRNDIVVLAQASMARAMEKVDENLKGKFLTSPVSGVRALR